MMVNKGFGHILVPHLVWNNYGSHYKIYHQFRQHWRWARNLTMQTTSVF